MNIGQYALIKPKQDRVLITGFYKVIPEPEINCEVYQEIIAEEKAMQIANNTYREQVRIAACTREEADLISYRGDHTGFYPINKEFTLLDEMIASKKTLVLYLDRNKTYIASLEKGEYKFTHRITKARMNNA